MKNKRLSVAALAAVTCLFSQGVVKAQTSQVMLSGVEIAKIKAQEFSRSLAQLKVQKVALERASPVDDKALPLNRAQQNALDQELVHLAVTPLIAERDHLAQDLRPAHPKMIALNAEIERAKASIDGNK